MDQITQTLMVGMQNGTTPLEQVWQFLIKLGIYLHLTLEKTSLIIVTESGSMVTWGWSWGWQFTGRGHRGTHRVDGKVLCLDYGGGCMGVYI